MATFPSPDGVLASSRENSQRISIAGGKIMPRPMFRILAAAFFAAFVSASANAQGPTGKVTVVTSFSKDVTDPIKKAFEKATPGVTLEVQNRNTNAGVKYVEETKANNQVDLIVGLGL